MTWSVYRIVIAAFCFIAGTIALIATGLKGSSFLDIKLIEIISILIQVAIGSILLWHVTSLTNKQSNVLRIRIDCIDYFLNAYKEIHVKATQYVFDESPHKNESLAREIKILLTVTSRSLDSFTQDIFKKNSVEHSITVAKRSYKKALTDSPFMTNEPYTDEQRSNIELCFFKLYTEFLLLKKNIIEKD